METLEIIGLSIGMFIGIIIIATIIAFIIWSFKRKNIINSPPLDLYEKIKLAQEVKNVRKKEEEEGTARDRRNQRAREQDGNRRDGYRRGYEGSSGLRRNQERKQNNENTDSNIPRSTEFKRRNSVSTKHSRSLARDKPKPKRDWESFIRDE